MSGSYHALAWLEPDSDFDLALLFTRVAKWLPGWEVSRRGDSIVTSSDGWEIWLGYVDQPHVAAEAREFPELFPDCPRSKDIARCTRRVEVACPFDDPDMVHFNDYVFALQALEEFKGVILFDPHSGTLI